MSASRWYARVRGSIENVLTSTDFVRYRSFESIGYDIGETREPEKRPKRTESKTWSLKLPRIWATCRGDGRAKNSTGRHNDIRQPGPTTPFAVYLEKPPVRTASS